MPLRMKYGAAWRQAKGLPSSAAGSAEFGAVYTHVVVLVRIAM